MKKILLLFSVIFAIGCASATSEEELQETEVLDKTIRIEVLTAQPKDDAIYITFFEYQTNTYNWQQYFFTYDSEGNAEPIIITLEDYDFRYIQGEIYRNNTIPSALFLKIYVDDELVVDESDEGDGTDFATVKFNYDILRKQSI